jgi:NAD(P)-dependent dehydrogenase (short-subunit alcohol dehydrogenase family)
MGKLDGKVAIITGAGGGIGRQHALLFAREGARVVVNDPGCDVDGQPAGETESGQERRSAVAEQVVEEILAAGGQAVANTDAVGTAEAAVRIVETALDAYGRLDVLVNNAGILRDRTILKMTAHEWDAVLEVHLKGTFTCLQAAARVMKEQQPGGGRIINTTSTSGLLGQFGQANYGAAKAGIYALTRIAAQEMAKYQITVNAIAPWAMTRMLAATSGVDLERARETLAPERVSPLVAWLATDAAAKSGVSGMVFGIEGNELFAYRMMTTHGATRHDGVPWTIESIGESIEQIIRW